MKNRKFNNFKILLVLGLIFSLSISCERDISDDAELATFPATGDIFTDTPIGLGSNFYFPYAPDASNPIGSKLDAWTVDNEVSYKGSASMRFDVPNGDDPEGNYAGGILRAEGARDLSGFTALTFWAKASQNVHVGQIGFGEDFIDNKYLTTYYNVPLTTNWKKYVIPIPDPSKLTQERGMLRYAAGSVDGLGYTFWIDELRFEDLGTFAQPRPTIFDGEDVVEQSFTGSEIKVNGFFTVNLLTGGDVSVEVAPAYFDYSSTNPAVASIDDNGVVNVIGDEGESAVITAKLNGQLATGSLTVESLGVFNLAPTPSIPESEVISIFSDAYTNVPVDFYNGYWEPWQTTESADFDVNGDNILNYINFNFVGIQFGNPTIDATEMTKAHFDIFVPGDVSGAQLLITLKDFGPNGVDGGDDDATIQYTVSSFVQDEWNSIDIPIDGLTRNTFGQIILENSGSTLTNFYLDNIFLHNSDGGTSIPTPSEAAPTPTQNAADVISIYSDTYTNIGGVDLNPNWGQATVVTEVSIDGNNTLLQAGLNYQGIDFDANHQDVSGKSFVHLDFWTENSTALNVYLISPGPVETAYALTVPTSGWTSVDIPLSSFSPVDLTDLFQFKFDGNGDIYIDNIYFY